MYSIVMNKLLVEPSPYKRIFSYVVDFIIALVLGLFVFATLGNSVLMDALGGNRAFDNITNFAVDSHLAYKTKETPSAALYSFAPDGKEDKAKGYVATPNGEKGYEAYLDRVWYYYTEFVNVAKNPDERIVSRTKSDGTPFSSLDYYQSFFFDVLGFDASSSKDNKYFVYAMDGDAPDYFAKPVLNATYQAAVDSGSTQDLEVLNNYFYFTSQEAGGSGIYYDAVCDLEGPLFKKGSVQTYYQEQFSKYSLSSYITEVICILPFNIIFFFVIPLTSKKGLTLGKRIFGLAVVNEEGYLMSTKQRIFRPLIVTLINSLFLMPNMQTGMTIYVILGAIGFFMMMFSKKKKANIQERITKTIVVDGKQSKIFASFEEKEEYFKDNDLDKYGNPNKVIVTSDGEPTVNLTKEE